MNIPPAPIVKRESGTRGRKVQLVCNYYRIGKLPQQQYKYLLKWDPLVEADGMLRQLQYRKFERSIREVLDTPVWDHSTHVLSPTKVKAFSPTNRRKDKGDKQRLTLEPAGVAEVGRQSTEAKRITGIMLNKNLFSKNYISFRNHQYFSAKPTYVGRNKSLQLMNGFSLTIVGTKGGLFACLDPKHRVCAAATAQEMLQQIREDCEDNREDEETYRARATACFVGAVALCTYNARLWRITGVEFDKTPMTEFDYKGKMTSNVTYLQERYPQRTKNMDRNFKGMLMGHETSKVRQPVMMVPQFFQVTASPVEVAKLGTTKQQQRRFQEAQMELSKSCRLSAQKRVDQISDILSRLSMKSRGARKGPTVELESNPCQVEGRVLDRFAIKTPQGNKPLPGGGRQFGTLVRSVGFLNHSRREETVRVALIYHESFRESRQLEDGLCRLAEQQGARLLIETECVRASSATNTEAWKATLTAYMRSSGRGRGRGGGSGDRDRDRSRSRSSSRGGEDKKKILNAVPWSRRHVLLCIIPELSLIHI